MEAKEHMERAWELLAQIPVSGDMVEVMFAVKQELREAYKGLEGEKNGGPEHQHTATGK